MPKLKNLFNYHMLVYCINLNNTYYLWHAVFGRQVCIISHAINTQNAQDMFAHLTCCYQTCTCHVRNLIPLSTITFCQLSMHFTTYWVSQKKHKKFFNLNLKLVMWINSMWLLLHFTQSYLTFERSFVKIHLVLTMIWLYDHEFKLQILANFEFFAVSNLSTNCTWNY